MARRTAFLSLRGMAAVTLAASTTAIAGEASAEKYASIVIDTQTDTVLHARHADAPRYPASLTKVMTLYMLFDEIKAGRIDYDEDMVVSSEAARQPPSNLRLKAGDRITVRDAIHVLTTKSANDVAVVVAERLGGTEARFAALMTVKARMLGLENTSFYNASGLPEPRQQTTARDMARLAEAMLEDHADMYHVFSTQSFRWNGRTYTNHNELLGDVLGVDGIKTGYTRASGFNLMSSAERDGHRIVAIMLGGRTAKARNAHVAELLEAAFASFDGPSGNRAYETRIAFDVIERPADPNAAATPTLNGKPFLVGEGDTVW